MIIRVLTFPLVVLAFLTIGDAYSAVVHLSQTRTIDCNAYAEDGGGSDQGSDSATATDFAAFTDGVATTISLSNALASGSANQNSEITSTGFAALGSCAANAEGYEEYGMGDAFGRTSFTYSFEVTVPADYMLSGYIESYDEGYTTLSWTGPSGTILDLDAGFNNTEPVSESGTLPPGQYTFTVTATSSCYGDFFSYGYGFAGFDLQLDWGTPTGIPDGGQSKGFSLSVSPNPAPGRTLINYMTPLQRPTTLEIYDLRGRLVRSLVTGGAASGSLIWDGRGQAGRRLSRGTYFLRLESGGHCHREKVTIIH